MNIHLDPFSPAPRGFRARLQRRPTSKAGRSSDFMTRPFASWLSCRMVGLLFLSAVTTFGGAEKATDPAEPASARAKLEALYARWKPLPRAELFKAAAAGNAEAEYYWGDTEFDNAWRDLGEAQKWLDISHGAGVVDIRQQRNLTDQEKAEATARWAEASEEELRNAAEAHNRGAAWILGQRKTDAAFERARAGFEYVLRAARQGLLPAQHFAGIQLAGSIWWHAIPADRSEGLRWLEEAAGQGYEPSQHKLAQFLVVRGPDSAEFVTGLEWLQKAAEQGCDLAQYQLARHYEKGEGEPRHDGETPVALYREAARRGLPEAKLSLADRYRTGLGVTMDYLGAIHHYRDAYDTAREYQRFNPAEPPDHLQPVFSEEDRVRESVASYLALLDSDGHVDPNRPAANPQFNQVFSVFVRGSDRGDGEALAQLGDYCLKGVYTVPNIKIAFMYYSLAADRGVKRAVEERDKLRPRLSHGEIEDAALRLDRYNKAQAGKNAAKH